VGECFFWYRPTRVVPDLRPLNGRCCCCCLLFSTWNDKFQVSKSYCLLRTDHTSDNIWIHSVFHSTALIVPVLTYVVVIDYYAVSSVLWRCWLGGRKGIRPVKNWVVICGVVICLESGADLHMSQLIPLPLTVSCFSKIQIGYTFLVPAHPGSPR